MLIFRFPSPLLFTDSYVFLFCPFSFSLLHLDPSYQLISSFTSLSLLLLHLFSLFSLLILPTRQVILSSLNSSASLHSLSYPALILHSSSYLSSHSLLLFFSPLSFSSPSLLLFFSLLSFSSLFFCFFAIIQSTESIFSVIGEDSYHLETIEELRLELDRVSTCCCL